MKLNSIFIINYFIFYCYFSFQYVRVINTLLDNGFTPITIDQDSEYYLTGNDIHVLKGIYPNISIDYKIEDKVVLNSVEEYEEMKKHLIGICDSVEKYNDLNTVIKMQIMNNISNLMYFYIQFISLSS